MSKEIFDINKPFPEKYKEYDCLLIQFQNSYAVYLEESLELNFLLSESEFLARFKRVTYTGSVAPRMETRVHVFSKNINPCIHLPSRRVSFLDFDNNFSYQIEGQYVEEFKVKSIDSSKWFKEANFKVITDKEFAEDIIQYYKLDNLYETRLMNIYNSVYFNSYGGSYEGHSSERSARYELDLFTKKDHRYGRN